MILCSRCHTEYPNDYNENGCVMCGAHAIDLIDTNLCKETSMKKYSMDLGRFINAAEVHSYYKNKLHEIIQENEKYDIEFSENMAIVHVAATKGLDVAETEAMAELKKLYISKKENKKCH